MRETRSNEQFNFSDNNFRLLIIKINSTILITYYFTIRIIHEFEILFERKKNEQKYDFIQKRFKFYFERHARIYSLRIDVHKYKYNNSYRIDEPYLRFLIAYYFTIRIIVFMNSKFCWNDFIQNIWKETKKIQNFTSSRKTRIMCIIYKYNNNYRWNIVFLQFFPSPFAFEVNRWRARGWYGSSVGG